MSIYVQQVQSQHFSALQVSMQLSTHTYSGCSYNPFKPTQAFMHTYNGHGCSIPYNFLFSHCIYSQLVLRPSAAFKVRPYARINKGGVGGKECFCSQPSCHKSKARALLRMCYSNKCTPFGTMQAMADSTLT